MKRRNTKGAEAINPLQGAAGQATVWTRDFRPPARSPLKGPASADVCVVGAGIAGLSVAYELQRSGVSVIVLDDGAIGSGMTSRTTAHLTCAIDDRFYEIERMHGTETMKLAAQSHAAAIDEIERVTADERIDCDFERLPGYLFLTPDGKTDDLDRDLDGAARSGLAVRREERVPLDGFDTGPCNRFDRQGAFHPLRYLGGLVDAIERRGGIVHAMTHAADWNATGRSVSVRTSTGAVVTAGSVVFATNVPINDRVVIHTKQAPYMTHVIAARIPRGSVPRALYWDLADPYHYVRLAPSPEDKDAFELLVVGGEDYKTGQGQDGEPFRSYARLEEWARARFRGMREVVLQWSGQVMEPMDGLAFIGKNPMDDDNVYVVTGDSGMGLTHGAVAGMLIRDLVLGRDNPWSAIYDPRRKPVGAPLAFARENLNVAGELVKSVTGGDVASTDEIAADAGAVVSHGLSKIAAYRDLNGELHVMSARCPHLGCLVAWNGAERTWDCPCHGSRFDAIGKVISGPANVGLAPAKAPERPETQKLPRSKGA